MSERPKKRVYGVREINRRVRTQLEKWGEVWIEGELFQVSRAGSGHVFMTLADAAAQLSVVMYRSDAMAAEAKLTVGERVRLLGRFSLYEPRGNLQLMARRATPAGDGDRLEALRKLHAKLKKEGLFEPERKRPIPQLPKTVGVVTSLRGAALFDVIRVANRRAPVRIVVADCAVQGPDAARTIVAALSRMARLPGLDVIILTRGGGAREDLAAFDDEAVVRAVAACPVPVVTGVGHQVDSTLVDFVADVRAATPSNAAETVVPDVAALRGELDAQQRHLQQAYRMAVGRARLQLERAARALVDPRRLVQTRRRALTPLSAAVERAARSELSDARARLDRLSKALHRHEPRAALARDRAALEALAQRLRAASRSGTEQRRRALASHDDDLRRAVVTPLDSARGALAEHDAAVRRAAPPRLMRSRHALSRLLAQLDALSPLAVLCRGYAIALGPDGKAVREAEQVAEGDTLTVRLGSGELDANVTAVRTEAG
ncbi:MAG: exodeoxyribonuclease VII large subunit [Sandaracinaceae bacterium]